MRRGWDWFWWVFKADRDYDGVKLIDHTRPPPLVIRPWAEVWKNHDYRDQMLKGLDNDD